MLHSLPCARAREREAVEMSPKPFSLLQRNEQLRADHRQNYGRRAVGGLHVRNRRPLSPSWMIKNSRSRLCHVRSLSDIASLLFYRGGGGWSARNARIISPANPDCGNVSPQLVQNGTLFRSVYVCVCVRSRVSELIYFPAYSNRRARDKVHVTRVKRIEVWLLGSRARARGYTLESASVVKQLSAFNGARPV